MKKINIRTILKFTIRTYQLTISPLLGSNCRFYPTCSNYAIEAIDKFGVFKGLKLSILRILKCNPFGPSGIDLVQDKDVKN